MLHGIVAAIGVFVLVLTIGALCIGWILSRANGFYKAEEFDRSAVMLTHERSGLAFPCFAAALATIWTFQAAIWVLIGAAFLLAIGCGVIFIMLAAICCVREMDAEESERMRGIY